MTSLEELKEEEAALKEENRLAGINVTQSAHEVKRATEGIAKSRDLLRSLKEARLFAKNEARVVLFTEFKEILKLITETEATLRRFTDILDREKINGKEAAERIEDTKRALARVRARLSGYGVTLQFPRRIENDD